MNTLNLKAQLTTLALIASIGGLFSPVASAYTVYTLANNYYAIVCTDGQIFSYSGGPSGIGIVAPSLCEGHGGIAGGNGGGLTALPATAEVSSATQSCVGTGGRKVNAETTACSTRIRVNRIEMKSAVSPRDAASGLPTGKR